MRIRDCRVCLNTYEDYGQKSSHCKPCKREYDREYHKNRCPDKKALKIKKIAERKKEITQSVIDYLKLNPCTVCGENRTATLQFDHRDVTTKESDVSNLMRSGSKTKLWKEIAKCDVLCANCHAIKTSKQFSWYEGLDYID